MQTQTVAPTPTITPMPTASPSSTPEAITDEAIYKSVNWAGYIATTDLQNPQPNVTAISASWTIPTIELSTDDTFSAVWIGIGGRYDQTLIQCGTEQRIVNGRLSYSVWYELLPENIIKIRNYNVHPGDQKQRQYARQRCRQQVANNYN